MGVQGLWQLLEPVGKPVDVSTLKGKVLAVDASIWLHQFAKGFRDKDGNPLPNAHLLGMFYRICKLLSYGIKPIFVFDGGVPILKRQTVALRRGRKLEAMGKADEARSRMLSNYVRQQLQRQLKQTIPSSLSPEKAGTSPKKSNTSPTKRFKDPLDEIADELQAFRDNFLASNKLASEVKLESDSSEDDEGQRRYGMDYADNFTTITSNDFDVLPLETQHEILSEMQESKKMNSWGRMDRMPKQMEDFSTYQMDRLVKRRFLQKKIQSVQQEMGQRHIHVQSLDELLKMDYKFDEDEVTGSQEKGFVLIRKNVIKHNEEANNIESEATTVSVSPVKDNSERVNHSDSEGDDSFEEVELANESLTKGQSRNKLLLLNDDETFRSIPDVEEEEQIALAIKLSLECDKPSTSTPSERGKSGSQNNILCDPDQQTLVFNDPPAHISLMKSTTATPISNSPVASSSTSYINQNSGSNENDDESSSSSDFEEVPEIAIELYTTKSSFVSEQPASNGRPRDSSVISIKLADITTEVISEEDPFADIFEEISGHQTSKTVEDSPSLYKTFTVSPTSSTPATPLSLSTQSTSTSTLDRPMQPTTQPQESMKGQGIRVISADYMQEQERMNKQQSQLQSAIGRQERVAASISEQMSIETQELLELFGIPYVISPMEAESQCAFLDTACLTDGTITDDSDCWLFGSLRVYKNFYATGQRPTEFYQMADITRNLNLDRAKLILIGMLIGGDYSEGIEGVGPVTALEIITEFPTNELNSFDVLAQFRQWWDLVNDSTSDVPPLSKIREKLRKLKLRPGFPNPTVYEAYVNPTVDSSTEMFQWGMPDFDAIREYTKKKFGWDSTKCDSMLLPVTKKLQCQPDLSKQLTLDSFVTSSRNLEKHVKRKKVSKRMESAMKKLKRATPASSSELALSSESSSDEESSSGNKETNSLENRSLQRNASSSSSISLKSSQMSTSKRNETSPQKRESERKNEENKKKAAQVLAKATKS